MSYWQKCPICDGTGLVSGGYFTSPGYHDEYGNWTSNNAAERCKVCNGEGILATPKDVEYAKQ